MIHPTRFVCLGLLAGSLTIATAARADIPITGGQVAGDAAFFLPRTPTTGTTTGTTTGGTTTGSTTTGGTGTTATTPAAPILFDTAIRTLRLVTPNGTSTTSYFVPNAARYTDTNRNGIPDRGDTGRLEGQLSGVAFSSSGSPTFFQGVPTALNFTLNSFSSSLLQGGTLISPQQTGTAPLVFLPIAPVTLSSASSANFTTQTGLLSVGAFDANLTGDFIGLPSNLQLRSSAGSTLPVVEALGRRIKFEFEGRNVVPTSASFNSQTLEFEGQTTSFKVQSVGTPGTQEFKIEGTAGTLDLTLTAPFDVKQNQAINPNAALSYEIKGEGPGYVALGNSAIGFTGTSRRDTSFRFEQGSNRFEGRSSGDISFSLSSGSTSSTGSSGTLTNFTPVTGVNNNGTNFVQSTSSSTSSTTSSGSSSASGSTSGGSTSGGSTAGGSTSGGSTTTATGSSSSGTSVNFFSVTFVLNSNSTYIAAFNPTLALSRSSDSQTNYTVFGTRGSVQVDVEQRGDRIVLIERQRGRRVGQQRDRNRDRDRNQDQDQDQNQERVISTYQVVGLPSRVFPGLVGLQQLPPESTQTTTPSSTGTTTTPSSTGTTTTPSSTGTTTTPSSTGTTTTPSSTGTTTTPSSTGTTTTPSMTTPGTTAPSTTPSGAGQ